MTEPRVLCSRIAIEDIPHGYKTIRKLHEFVPSNFRVCRIFVA
jgi:hypothetical protein